MASCIQHRPDVVVSDDDILRSNPQASAETDEVSSDEVIRLSCSDDLVRLGMASSILRDAMDPLDLLPRNLRLV